MATSKIQIPDSFSTMVDITSGDDLNNYDQYFLGNKEKEVLRWATDSTPAHSPVGDGGYTLWVIRAQWGVIQIAVYYNDIRKTYIRSKFGTGAWDDWYKISMTVVQ